MRAGFAKARITPPIGTRLSGFGGRDQARPADAIHDDLFVRLLYLEEAGQPQLIAGFDLLFFSRENADRLKAAVGRVLDLTPRQILLNTSHTHAGPCVSTWAYERGVMPDWDYLNIIERALCQAALQARAQARPVTPWVGQGRTRIPLSRRRPDGKGGVEWRPYPEAKICDSLPVCLFRDEAKRPVGLLFSISCHPSTVGGWSISADYPGVACQQLDAELGVPCSVFLQGAAGDTKAMVTGRTTDATGLPCFQSAGFDGVAEAGHLLAQETLAVLPALAPAAPCLRSVLLETYWPLQPLPDKAGLESQLTVTHEARAFAVREHLRRLERGLDNPSQAAVLAHGIQVAQGFRLLAIEGELVGELGNHLIAEAGAGVTMPLGYSNGTGLYLPSSRMIAEGGYEVESHHEYGFGAPLATGAERLLSATLGEMRAAGVV